MHVFHLLRSVVQHAAQQAVQSTTNPRVVEFVLGDQVTPAVQLRAGKLAIVRTYVDVLVTVFMPSSCVVSILCCPSAMCAGMSIVCSERRRR